MSLNLERLDRSVAGVTTFAEAEQEGRQFWHHRTPEERLIYFELACLDRLGHNRRYLHPLDSPLDIGFDGVVKRIA
jgi:hypothetical protein